MVTQISRDASGVVGFGALVPTKGEVRAVYVHPRAARRGVGSAILAQLETLALAHADSCDWDQRRRFDVLICWRLDRLGRNLKHLVTMLEEPQALGIGFVSLGEGIDLSAGAIRQPVTR